MRELIILFGISATLTAALALAVFAAASALDILQSAVTGRRLLARDGH